MMPEKHYNNSKGCVLWLTGLSGAGKTTLANGLRTQLAVNHYLSCVIDGDEIRKGLSSDLGFSEAERRENNRRVAEVARLMASEHFVVITALISPYRTDRSNARSIVTSSGISFLEIFVDTPLAVCERRDPKGHYQRARARQITNFTGIDVPYEDPASPDIVVYPAQEAIDDSVRKVMQIVLPNL